MKKLIGSMFLVAATAATAAVESGCGRGSAAGEPPAPLAPPGEVWLTEKQVKDAHIGIEPVAERAVGGSITAAGRVTFDDLRVAHVFSPVTGRVTKILVQPGERVKKGQSLCLIQSPDLGSAVSDMAKARAALIAAEKDWHRQQELFRLHASSQKDYEAAESVYLGAKAELERAQRKAKLLREKGLDLVTQEYHLPSPIEGEVITRNANPGLEIQGQYTGGANVELFTIGETDRVWVLADIFEMDLPRVKKGAEVNVRVGGYPNDVFTGQVEWISGALDPTSRTAKVRCSIANPERKLRAEMFGTARIILEPDVKLAIKRSAILLIGEKPYVFAHVGMTPNGMLKFTRRSVVVEEKTTDEYLPLKSGIEPGEKVVIEGGVLLLSDLLYSSL